MKRSDYLKLCVSAAMLSYRKPKVLYAGIEYYPEGYELHRMNSTSCRLKAM